MIWFLVWLATAELLGLAVLPVTTQLLRSLPDRGYIFSKPLGLLLVGYICWVLGMFGMLRYQQATIVIVLLLLGAASWALWERETLRLLAPIRTVVVTQELLFVAFLAVAALIRAYNPDISGTEKPMDFALMNAVYRSDQFPPEDPWMSGLSISYYYFGYLLMATMAKLSGVIASAGYNLAVAEVFALLLVGSFSLAFNLLSSLEPAWRLSRRLAASLVAPLLIGVMGNLEIGFEVLAARGLGDASFWNWVGVKGLQAGPDSGSWLPTSHWWWWRASRIIPTTKPDGINEFPFFSFILGDLHPHFMALPWALLALALAMAAVAGALRSRRAGIDDGGGEGSVSVPSEASRHAALLRWLSLLVPSLSLGFLLVGNSWDFPTYTGVYWLASLAPLARRPVRPWDPAMEPEDATPGLRDTLRRLLLVCGFSLLLYLPFFLGFSSQTRGIGISADKTPLLSLLIIFGPVFFVLGCFLLWRGWPVSRRGDDLGRGRASGAEPASIRYSMAGIILDSPQSGWALWGGGLVLVVASSVMGAVVLLLGLLLLASAAVRRLLLAEDIPHKPESAASRFLLLMVVIGLLLVLVPEFFFLADLFGTRMNTVFKFHYQAWLMLGLAASVGGAWMACRCRGKLLGWVVILPAVLLVSVGLLYPVAATLSKADGFKSQPDLDGAAFFQKMRPDDYAAIQWLSRAAPGRPVVLEATGGEYSEYARVSTFSGLPAVLGWGGHETQWRGSGEEAQRRASDVEAIYRTADRSALPGLLARYRVRYVFVGSLEIEKYGPEVTSRFDGVLEPVNRQGKVTIYMVPGSVAGERPSVTPAMASWGAGGGPAEDSTAWARTR